MVLWQTFSRIISTENYLYSERQTGKFNNKSAQSMISRRCGDRPALECRAQWIMHKLEPLQYSQSQIILDFPLTDKYLMIVFLPDYR